MSDLPAPKGHANLPAPKAGGPGDLPAPKGFFDDLPQPSQNRGGGGGSPDLPAPKGFFDDLPQPSQNRAPELPAPKGFFDDLPQVSQNRAPELPAPKGFFDNLPANRQQPNMMQPPGPLSAGALFGDAAGASGGHQIELGDGGPELNLDPSHTSGYDDLDLSKPSAHSTSRSGYEQPPQQQQPQTQQHQQQQRDSVAQLPSLGRGHGGDMSLELEEPRRTSQKLGPKKKDKGPDPQVLQARGKRQKIILGAVLGVALLGGVGVFAYQHHAAAEARAEEIATDLATARTALSAADAGHWRRALSSAKKAQELAETDPDALGLGAEAAFAGAFDDGQNAPGMAVQGNKMINTAREAGVTSPALDRAIALSALAANQGDRALAKLQPLAAAAPTDGFLQLYLGWALAMKGDPKAAVTAFDQAMTASPATKLPALYARGKAKLALADLEGARADFVAVLALAKDHIGAQVGLAAATPPSQSAQQEADLLALLQRKEIDSSDPRARVQAWTLAADDARRGGRLDAARERYRKALALSPNDVPATTGLAEVELRDNKLDLAYELITKAVTAAPNDVRAQLVYCELAIRQGKLDDADSRIKVLAAKDPPPTPLELARLGYVKGKLLDARGDSDGAIQAWAEGGKAGGELDLSPTMAAVGKLGALAKDAVDPAKAAQYRTRADELLGALGAKAQKDPALALTLGTAYLEAGDATKAESWLRNAEDARPKDPEAKFQLAKALTHLARYDEAIEELRGAIELDPSRADIGLELAKTFELAGRDPDAGAQYDALLTAKDPAVELRARAGRFYARTNQMTKAVGQSEEILRLDPTNAAGFYLKGEGLLAAGKPDEASRAFQSAVDADPDSQYFDAQGRAAEARALASGDTKYQELALRAYEQASKLSPAMFNPLAGEGRLLIMHGEWQKALPLLVSANKLRSDDADVMYNLGRVHAELNLKPAAIAWFVKSELAAPKAETFHQLADLYTSAEINDGKDAIIAWSHAIDLARVDEQKGATIDWLTDAYFQRGLLRGTLGDARGQACDYQKFTDRHPAAGARLDEARRDLATKLRGLNAGCP
jgi:tetratricopeptide (TPR) repeat protein